eukprot:2336848-Rhodomonas_salina.2
MCGLELRMQYHHTALSRWQVFYNGSERKVAIGRYRARNPSTTSRIHRGRLLVPGKEFLQVPVVMSSADLQFNIHAGPTHLRKTAPREQCHSSTPS